MDPRTIEYALMAGSAYFSTRGIVNQTPVPEGWEPLDPDANLDHITSATGFEARAFRRGDEIVIAYAGTYGNLDWFSANFPLLVGSYSPQLSQAAAFYQEIKAAHPDATISFTGHSLGGGLAALMGVFFDKEAVTFDPAPFRNAASLANMAVLTIDLAVRGFFDSDLVSFFNIGGFVRGESNISQYAVAGEALSYFALNLLKIGNDPVIIGQGSENASVFDLHSQALLIALAQSRTLRTTSIELPFLIPDLFDENLFASDTSSDNRYDLLSHLVRYEFGVPGQLNTKQRLVTHFSDDMSKLGAYRGQYDDILRPLSHLGMQHYYQTLGTFQREFFTSVQGGIQFDLTRPLGDQVTALADIKGYSEFLEGIRDRIPLEALADVDAYLTEAARITVALADSIEAWAQEDNTPDFMLAGEREGVLSGNGGDDLLVGGNSSDSLYGGDGQDYLFGGNGNDSLYGGEDGDYLDGGVGVNYLYGGNGFDTYVFSTDTSNIGTYNIIFDEDGFGELNFLNINSPLQSLESKGPNHWESTDGSIRINRFSSGVETYSLDIQFLDGSHSPIRIRDFENGDLGVTLPGFEADSVPEVVTTNVINGTSDDDNLSGTAANDAINGGGGNDSIDGLGGDDVIDAGAGDDGVDGGAGDDHIMGGDGEDSLLGNSGNDVIEGGAGFDWILGDAGDDMLFANAAEDYNTILDSDGVTPGTDNDWLNADIGNDLLVGSTGNNGLSGGEGNDRLYGGAGNDVMFGDQYWNASSTWSMTIQNNEDGSISPVFVDAWTNTLGEPGPGGNDILIGGAGDDYLSGDRGSDVLDGGIGNDLILGGSGEDTIMAGDGDDRVYGDDLYINVTTPDGNGGQISEKRYLYDEHGADIIDGGAGQDELYGYGGDDILTGGEGNDTLYGDGREEHLPGQYHGDDQLDGGAGDDRLIGHGGNDRLIGGDGNDTLAGDAIESDLAGEFHGDDYLEGGAGEDILAGLGGDDTLYGGDGNDLVDGDAHVAELAAIYHGNDTLYGGRGEDTLWGSGGSDELHGGEDNDRLEGDAPDVAGEYHGEDTLYGDAGDDTILGGGAGDRLFGGDGNDQILGDDFAGISEQYHGDDYIDGGSGEDVIRGNGGNDTIIGGLGVDHMGGGAGDDVYILNVGDSFYDPAGLIEVIDDQEGVNTIRFGVGITADDVTAQVWDDNLQLSFGSNDSVWLQGGANGNAVSQFEFADGSELNWSEFFGRAYKTPLDLASGDFGASLFGGAGDDSLLTFGGHSLISGGAGNDTLGGAGGDIFLFSAGDGADLISESGLDANAPNIVRFGAGVSRDMLSFAMQGNDLLVRVGFGTGDSLLIQNFRTDTFTGATTINRFEFQDGSSLSYAEVRDEQGFVYIGGDAAESQSGTASTDRMLGLGGNDVLDSGGGDDFLAGGAGDDVMRGGAGYDSYYVGNFEGIDRIEEVDDGAGNELQFGYGITPDNISISTTETGDLIFKLADEGEVFVENGFGEYGPQLITSVLFYDGVEWTSQDLLDHYLTSASPGNDYLQGTNLADVMDGGEGADTLVGGEGDDLYLHNYGDGKDTIIDVAGNDTLRFGDEINAPDIGVASDGVHLTLSYNSGVDSVVIQSWFVDPANQIESIEFFDGTTWSPAVIDSALTYQVGTSGDDSLVAPELLGSTLLGLAGNDSLFGSQSDDILDGGLNDDLLVGSTGNDTYLFQGGFGSDLIQDTFGFDIIEFDSSLASSDIYFNSDGTDLILHDGVGNQIRVDGWHQDDSQVEQIIFGDGVVMQAGDIISALANQFGTDQDDSLTAPGGYSSSLDGAAGNDSLMGAELGDTLRGGAGDDYLNGQAGDDLYLFGLGDGVDTISDSGGSDELAFDEGITEADITVERFGNDVLFEIANQGGTILVESWFLDANTGSNMIESVSFFDGTRWSSNSITQSLLTLYGTSNDDDLVGVGDYDNTIYGLGGTDTITTGGGNDTLEGGLGVDHLSGGDGDDTYIYSRGDDTDYISDSSGYDRVVFGEGITIDQIGWEDNLNTDTIYIIIDKFQAYQKNIYIDNWKIGADGQYKIEEFVFSDGSILYGKDIPLRKTLNGDGLDNTLLGGNYDENIYAEEGDDIVLANGGNDWIYGEEGADELSGGEGDDVIIGDFNNTAKHIYNDTLSGGAGNDKLWGDGGDDFLDGGSGDDLLYGDYDLLDTKWHGDDVLIGGLGNDTMVGGFGDDTYYVDSIGDNVVEESGRNSGNDLVISTVDFTLSENVENLTLSGDKSISGIGNALSNTIIGNDADNLLDGGAGSDELRGGKGNDIYYVDESRDKVVENAGEGSDTVVTESSYSLGSNVENLIITGIADADGVGTSDDNVLRGNSGANKLDGNAGNDTLWGGAGDDILIGDIGSDTYYFGRGDNSDQITDQHSAKGKGPVPENYDVLLFGESIGEDQLWFVQDRSDLIVSVIGTSDQVTINNWYRKDDFHIEEFRTSNGLYLLDSQVDNLVSAMANFAPPPPGQTTLSEDYRTQLEPVISSNWQS